MCRYVYMQKERILGGFTGDTGGVMLSNNSNYNTSGQDFMAGSSQQYPLNPLNNLNPFSIPQYNTNPPMQQPYYHPPPMQPPPPPSYAGYLPTCILKSENVTNIASSSSGVGLGRGYARPGPGYAGYAAAMGAGAVVGAAAGLYGGDYMSGSYLLSNLPRPNVSIAIDPPF